jgi:hypothetical protein
MKFKVTKNDQSFEIDSFKLFELISNQIVKNDKDDHVEMARTILDYLKVTDSIESMSLGQIMTLAFSSGYFYRIFYEKNNIEIVKNENEILSKNNNL